MHHHTAASLLPLILALDGDPGAAAGTAESKGTQLVYRDCIDATGDAQSALIALSDGAVKEWLEGYKKVMEQVHGRKANDGWAAAGFPGGRPSVPRNHAARQALLSAARAYLSGHAGYETDLPRKDLPPLAVTAAQALALHTQMQNAQTLIDTRTAEQALCKQARDAGVDALYDEVSGATAELHDLLPDTDARWEVFGLNIPANPTPPLAVATLTLSPAGAGRLLAEWSYAVRAEYYRVFLKTTGSPDAAVNIADPQDLEYTLKGLTSGTTVEVQVVPMNDAGAGPASPVVTAVVP